MSCDCVCLCKSKFECVDTTEYEKRPFIGKGPRTINIICKLYNLGCFEKTFREKVPSSIIFTRALEKIRYVEGVGVDVNLEVATGHSDVISWRAAVESVGDDKTCTCADTICEALKGDGFWEFEKLVMAVISDVLISMGEPPIVIKPWYEDGALKGEDIVHWEKYDYLECCYHCTRAEMLSYMEIFGHGTRDYRSEFLHKVKKAALEVDKYILADTYKSYLYAQRELRKGSLNRMAKLLEQGLY